MQLKDKECQIIRSNHKTTNSIDYLKCFKNRITRCTPLYKFFISVTYIILFSFPSYILYVKFPSFLRMLMLFYLRHIFFLVFSFSSLIYSPICSQSLFLYDKETDQTSDMNFTNILNFHTRHNISQRLQVVG